MRTNLKGNQGLSPRVRGNQRANGRRPGRGWSIPACAGEPANVECSCAVRTVYPRVCGGTRVTLPAASCARGLSPRVRGNHRPRRRHPHDPGSIPACAGEPRRSPTTPARARVYPRVCGGTPVGRTPEVGFHGLSPRVRGNLPQRPPLLVSPRSIPSCAGEPQAASRCTHIRQVYPRVCGGTVTGGCWQPAVRSLSPRVRGNPQSLQGQDPAQGLSPRVRGTISMAAGACIGLGLSPRVRGNLMRAGQCQCRPRSIPACAGEPSPSQQCHSIGAVYPRVCGGTRRRLE